MAVDATTTRPGLRSGRVGCAKHPIQAGPWSWGLGTPRLLIDTVLNFFSVECTCPSPRVYAPLSTSKTTPTTPHTGSSHDGRHRRRPALSAQKHSHYRRRGLHVRSRVLWLVWGLHGGMNDSNGSESGAARAQAADHTADTYTQRVARGAAAGQEVPTLPHHGPRQARLYVMVEWAESCRLSIHPSRLSRCRAHQHPRQTAPRWRT